MYNKNKRGKREFCDEYSPLLAEFFRQVNPGKKTGLVKPEKKQIKSEIIGKLAEIERFLFSFDKKLKNWNGDKVHRIKVKIYFFKQ